MRRTTILVILAAALGSADATTTVVTDLDAQVARADEIHLGTIMAIESRWQAGVIVSRIRIAVDETLKGRRTAALDVEVDGGLIDGVRMEVLGAPRWRVGDRSLLFLRRGSGQLRPAGLARAKVDVGSGAPGAALIAQVRALARRSAP